MALAWPAYWFILVAVALLAALARRVERVHGAALGAVGRPTPGERGLAAGRRGRRLRVMLMLLPPVVPATVLVVVAWRAVAGCAWPVAITASALRVGCERRAIAGARAAAHKGWCAALRAARGWRRAAQ